jgi:hypothetical protein
MAHDRLVLRKLCNSLRTELAEIDQVRGEYARFTERYGNCMDEFLYRAVASFMADFYLGVEAVFTAVADELDGGAPIGRNWHRRLLASMAAEKTGVRPAVISPELRAALTPFLVFRHVIPQSYCSTFDERKLTDLEKHFPPTQELFSREMHAFCDQLTGEKR